MTSRFASSLRKSMRPLSFNGIFASDCHEQLKALLSRNRDRLAAMGMPNAETFLAEPMYDAGTGQIDWYHEGATPPVPLLSLPPEERARAEQELACCSRALDSLLADLSAQPAMSVQAGLLREALQHPGPDDVFVQDGHIVLVNWGYKPGTSSAAPVEIGRDSVPDVPVLAKTPPAVQAVQPPVRPAAQPAAAPVQPAPEAPAASFAGPAGGFAAAPGMTDNVANPEPDPEPAREEPARFFRDEPGPDRTVYAQAPQPEPEPAPEPAPAADGVRGAGCLSWLLPLLLLALLLWLILAALGLAPSPLPAGCFHTATAPAGAAAEQDRARRQAGELAALQRQLEEHAAQCPRTDGTKPAPLFEERGLDAVPGAGPEAPAPGIVPEVGGGAVIVPDGTVPESVPGTEGEALVPGVAPDGEAGPLPDETPAVPPSEGTVPEGEAVVPFFGEEPGGSAGDAPLGGTEPDGAPGDVPLGGTDPDGAPGDLPLGGTEPDGGSGAVPPLNELPDAGAGGSAPLDEAPAGSGEAQGSRDGGAAGPDTALPDGAMPDFGANVTPDAGPLGADRNAPLSKDAMPDFGRAPVIPQMAQNSGPYTPRAGAAGQQAGQNGQDGQNGQNGRNGQNGSMDQDFLGGCWRSQDPLYRSSTDGQQIVVEYCFDKNGRGRRSHYANNKKLCTGSLSHRSNGRVVTLDAQGLACPNGSDYAPQHAECYRVGSRIQCRGSDALGGGRTNIWDAYFTKPR